MTAHTCFSIDASQFRSCHTFFSVEGALAFDALQEDQVIGLLSLFSFWVFSLLDVPSMNWWWWQ